MTQNKLQVKKSSKSEVQLALLDERYNQMSEDRRHRVRAYAVNSAGTSYGSTVGFTTLKAGDGNFLLFI